jgi:chromosome partitioning protein
MFESLSYTEGTPMRIAITNLKGGTGKTTTAMHIAAGLATHGRTLLIDADEQCSATAWSTLIEGDRPFDVVTDSGSDLHVRLNRLMATYAHVVVDAPPHDAAVVRSAIQLATHIVIPLSPSAMDVNRLWPMIDLATTAHGRTAPSVLVLLTKVRPHTRLLRVTRETLDEMGVPVSKIEIPQRESYRTAFGTVPHDPERYQLLVDELLGRVVVAA